jgi:hypothetical protein
MSRPRATNKIYCDDPLLYECFKKHLEDNNSFGLFKKYMTHGEYVYFTKFIMKEEKFALLKQKYCKNKTRVSFLGKDLR